MPLQQEGLFRELEPEPVGEQSRTSLHVKTPATEDGCRRLCPDCGSSLGWRYVAWDLAFKKDLLLHFGYWVCSRCCYESELSIRYFKYPESAAKEFPVRFMKRQVNGLTRSNAHLGNGSVSIGTAEGGEPSFK
jgi:hypothetical protein